jgi:formylglycine-generating enzyme required for sulfatase activity
MKQNKFSTAMRFFALFLTCGLMLLSCNKDKETGTKSNIELKMVSVDGGTFNMGAQSSNSGGVNYDSGARANERPVHSVTLSSFYIGETEVTQALWLSVMGSWPGDAPSSDLGVGSNYPVYYINWRDIVGIDSAGGLGYSINGVNYYKDGFCYKLSCAVNGGTLGDKHYRLPTEAEWEYAARGGNKTHGYKYSGSNNIGDVAWYGGNNGESGTSSYGTKEVGKKQPNELGLYDMSGNVWEWCSDGYGTYSSVAQTNPTGKANSEYHVVRSGGWDNPAWCCCVSFRENGFSSARVERGGFRLACSSK